MADLQELVPLLLARTVEGKLSWEVVSNDSVITRLDEVTLELYAAPRQSVRLLMRDDQARVLETLSWEEMPSPEDEQLNQLWTIARRKALKIDQYLDKIKNKLDRL